MTPEQETVAYRAWVEAEKIGWNLTLRTCAGRINVSRARLQGIMKQKGWINHFRVPSGIYADDHEPIEQLDFENGR